MTELLAVFPEPNGTLKMQASLEGKNVSGRRILWKYIDTWFIDTFLSEEILRTIVITFFHIFSNPQIIIIITINYINPFRDSKEL